jgi:hypothetical protein
MTHLKKEVQLVSEFMIASFLIMLLPTSVMYIKNVHLKLYLYFSDKLLSKRTGILETFVSR